MEKQRVICIAKYGEEVLEDSLIELNETYIIEEEVNRKAVDEVDNRELKKYPNPYYVLEGVAEICACCGERVSFWHGLFKKYTPKNEEVNI